MNDRIKAVVFDIGGVLRLSGGEGMNALEHIADMIGVPSDEFGYIPVLFKNNEQLRSDLKKLGIALA